MGIPSPYVRYAHNSQPLSELNVSLHEIVFHTRPRKPLTFDLNLNRDTSKICISSYCSPLPEHSHYDKTDRNPFFYKTLSKPIPQWFLAVETAMLQIYSTVYENTLRKINSHAYNTKTYHEVKPLLIGTFVLKLNFTRVHFSDKLEPLRIGPYKIIDGLSDVTYELLSQGGSTEQQSQDPVLRTVYSWIINNEKPESLTPLITGTPLRHAYYKNFSQLFIDDSTNLIRQCFKNPTVLNQPSTPDFVHATIRICLPFRLFKTVFNKLYEHSHTGIKITYITFARFYYIPFVEKWLSIFIHDCIECQRNKHFNVKIQTAPTQSFSELAPSFNYHISMDTFNPPPQNKSFIHVITDAFSHFVLTVPIKTNNAKTAIITLLHHWIIKFGPPIYLVTDRGSEYANKEMAHLCTLMGIRHSPRTAYSPWTNGLVEVHNRNLGTHLRMFLHDTPKDWAFQVHMYVMHITLNHFQNSMFLFRKSFFTQDPENPLPSI